MVDRDDHFRWLVDTLLRGEVVPFLGAGVNLCTRGPDVRWSGPEAPFLPNGSELAAYLAARLNVSGESDLLRVSQCGATTRDLREVYTHLRPLFTAHYDPTPVHGFLASLPRLTKELVGHAHYPLIITTNYDDLMEKALENQREKYDLVFYDAEGAQKGKFWHVAPEKDPVLILRPNTYAHPFLNGRSTILKIHGTVRRDSPNEDSFVITEDHYIEYLANRPLEQILPATLLAHIQNKRMLFLGYSLRDWNLRVFLRRLVQAQRLGVKHWAVMRKADDVDRSFWRKTADIEIIDQPLDSYVAKLSEELEARA